MKKILKLMVSALMMFCLVLPAFAGGGQQGAKAVSKEDIGFNPTGYPVVSKPYSFSAAVLKRPMHGSYDQMEAVTNMEKKTGIHVQWIEIPEANFRERMNLMLASSDLPDVFMSGLTDSDIVRYGPSGTLVPLEKLADQYAPNIKDLFAKRPDIKKYVTAPDGHVYTLPRIQELAHRVNPDNMFINKTWLDKLGLNTPQTPEEFYAVLKAFKERDPNGNGKKDIIPFSFIGGSQSPEAFTCDIFSLFAEFGMPDNMEHVIVQNGKVVFTANTQEFRNALIYFNKLYSEGLIDPEAFTQDLKQYTAKGSGPDMLFGVFMGWFDENYVGADRARKDYIVLPPLKGVDGKQHWNTVPYMVLNRDNFGLTSKMKNPEVAIRWADLCYDWETSFELCYGPWGINLKKDGNKIIQLPPPAGMSPDDFRYLHSPAMSTPFAVYEADHKNLNLAENHVRKFARLDMYRQFFPPQNEIYPKVFFLPEEESELAIIRTDIQNHVQQMRARFITGSESINTGWDNYVQQLNQMGLARYIEIYQKALDRYNKG